MIMRRGCVAFALYLVAVSCWGAYLGSDGHCPGVCSCKWKYGKQSVECTDRGLIAIPESIDPETQLLDLSNNNLQVLPKETFERAKLTDLQKVYLRDCKIGQIDDRALVGLSNVVDLDLSRNLLTAVPSSIFEDVRNLRNLSLAHNPIQKIDASAFRQVRELTKLDLSHCQITVIASRAFDGLDRLELLRLNGNRLSELKLKAVDALGHLHGVELHDNPWYCDCGLRTLKKWLIERHVPYPIEPVCAGGPARVHNRTFATLHADDFACRPEMKIKPEARHVESTAGDNATILCRVESVPEAAISWYWNGRLLLNNTAFSPHQRIVIHHSGGGDAQTPEKRSVLTLTNAQVTDSSQFHCVAENQAGVAEANFTLRVVHRLAGFAVFDQNPVTSISVLLLVGVVGTFLGIIYLMNCFRKVTVREAVKHASAVGEEIVANGTVHRASHDDKTLTIEPSLAVMNNYHINESQTLPRIHGTSYTTSASPRYEYGSSAYSPTSTYRHHHGAETSNPDLIADTRYQEDLLTQNHSGVYTRCSDNMFYPSSLMWNQNDDRSSSNNEASDFRDDTNDRTPIIEEAPSSFYENSSMAVHRPVPPLPHRPLKDCEFPTTSSPPAGESLSSGAYGPPNDAKIMRVWQKGVHVLPPVTALKRVLNRNSPDEGYQEGCGTDV